MAALPERVDILGVGVHALNMDSAVAALADAVTEGRKGYVCVTGVHGIMEAQGDEQLRQILNGSFLTTPDGMPTVWIGRSTGHKAMRRVYGPELMLQVCQASVAAGWTHYFYGGNEGVADELKQRLQQRYPGLQVVGTYTPPFRPLNESEEQALIDDVAAKRPDFFWVGLSTPKQERFMADYIDRLDTTVMLGVGAAFDIHTDRVREAPGWIQTAGLQWLHRLAQEPSRLGPRYLVNNPKFVAKYLMTRLKPSQS
ncbi:MAG: WecB/TagA/CpsF family glycosyltransferase [Gammaproteobacteria bacterium]|nr:WecB/TagA/CpsF family glycosyltransferase [Gammaproteobacteria bacterium]NND60158.1 WecB/TagA/CpsF family glycosyltransferase [Gammaproteobacteria bacterium]